MLGSVAGLLPFSSWLTEYTLCVPCVTLDIRPCGFHTVPHYGTQWAAKMIKVRSSSQLNKMRSNGMPPSGMLLRGLSACGIPSSFTQSHNTVQTVRKQTCRKNNANKSQHFPLAETELFSRRCPKMVNLYRMPLMNSCRVLFASSLQIVQEVR